MKRTAGLVAAIAVAGLTLTGCGLQSGTSTSPDASGSSAPVTGTVTIYSPRPANITDHVVQAFEDKYPDVTVNLLTLGAAEVADRVKAEKANPQGDVWWGGTPSAFETATADGELTPFGAPVLSAVPAEYHGTGDNWVAEEVQYQVIAYNKDMLSEDQVPQDWSDLVDPKWKDKILIRDVAPSGTMRSIFTAMIDQTFETTQSPDQGYAYLKALDANTKDYAANPSDLYLRVQRQEAPLTVWNQQDILSQAAAGAPFGIHVPTSGSPINKDGIAEIKGGPNPAAAEAFAEFLLSDETQTWLAENAFQIPTIKISKEPDWMSSQQWKELPVNSATTTAHEQEWIDYWLANIKNQG